MPNILEQHVTEGYKTIQAKEHSGEANPRKLPTPEHLPTNTTTKPTPKNSRSISSKGERQNLLIFVTFILIAWIGWKVAHEQYYTSRSPFGFYLGVAGSLMMLAAVLGYPLRKRMGFMQRWGKIKHWFRIHMFLGIVGPMLILFHATFHVRSPNAGVALISMLLVVASGVIGRFIYSKIHFGLYGRRATVKSLQEQLQGSSEEAQSYLATSSKVGHWLQNFEHSALKTNRPFPESAFYMFGLGLWRKWLEFRCNKEIRRVFKEKPKHASKATRLISSYLKGIQQIAQFKMYERIFSLWHVLHIPLIYILAATGVFHVIAVYMY